MTRLRLPLLTGAAFGLLILLAYYSAAMADTGGPPDPTDAGALWSGRLASLIILVSVIGLWILDRLAGTRWRWTRWLRVGRRQASISAALGIVVGVLPAAFSGELTSRAGWEAATAVFLAFKVPGGMEAAPLPADADDPPMPLPGARVVGGESKPDREASGEIDDGQVPS